MTPIRIAAVGDVGLTGRVADGIRRSGPGWLLQRAASAFEGSDLTVFNLEMPFAPAGAAHPKHVRSEFRANAEHVGALSFPGVRVAVLANNHVADFGDAGIERTRTALDAAGILHVGAGRDLEEARRPAVAEIHGRRIAVLAYAARGAHSAGPGPGAAPADPTVMREDVDRLRSIVDVLVVNLHHGTTYVDLPSPEDRRTALDLAEAGADVVIGHHPHVLQGTERVGRSVVAHSLGEFAFDGRTGFVFAEHAEPRRRMTTVLRLTLGGSEEIDLDLVPITIDDDGRPVIPEGDSAEATRRRIHEVDALLRLPDYGAAYRENAAKNLAGHELRVLAHAVRRLDLRYLAEKVTRIRMRHVRMAAERLQQLFGAKRGSKAS